MKQKALNILKSTASSLAIFSVAVGLSIGLDQLKINSEVILLVYILAILAITIETKAIIYPAVASFAFVFLFNFLFTEPKYSFAMEDPSWYIVLSIFLIVTMVIYVIIYKMQSQIVLRKANEQRNNCLYEFSIESEKIKELNQILTMLSKSFANIFGSRVTVIRQHDQQLIDAGTNSPYLLDIYYPIIRECFESNAVCGYKEIKFSSLPAKCYPISISRYTFGVVMVFLPLGKNLQNEEREFVQTLVLNAANVMAKKSAEIESEKVGLEIEKEKFKTTLLRSLSHDIKTPLTSIQSGTSFLIDSYTKIDDETKKDMLKNINEETIRLNDFVDNLLNITRISTNNLIIKKKSELASEIVEEAIRSVKSRLGKQKIKIAKNEDDMIVECDAKLIIQVMKNLLNNAMEHSKIDSTSIEVAFYSKSNNAVFSVSDNGGGISESAFPQLFKDFSTFSSSKGDKHRGNGLGLSICKSIIAAHGGEIFAKNNDHGGADFTFTFPKGGTDEKSNSHH
ncbi:MAG: ATP-binding protein [Bacilli bacterium]|jgi:two-component system sensor histidine kinase KdpD